MRAALHGNADQDIGADAKALQLPRQLIGPGIELAVAPAFVVDHQRRSVRGARRLSFE
ncbi:hypothetical protein PBDP_4028 [Pseudomonas sp. St290]|nr:hypothetical protein PBDP_4028 [Pseudomonas sp. St290]